MHTVLTEGKSGYCREEKMPSGEKSRHRGLYVVRKICRGSQLLWYRAARGYAGNINTRNIPYTRCKHVATVSHRLPCSPRFSCSYMHHCQKAGLTVSLPQAPRKDAGGPGWGRKAAVNEEDPPGSQAEILAAAAVAAHNPFPGGEVRRTKFVVWGMVSYRGPHVWWWVETESWGVS